MAVEEQGARVYVNMKLRLTGAEWTERVNMLEIRCSCGRIFTHRADRWRVECPSCQYTSNLAWLREQYVEERRRNTKP